MGEARVIFFLFWISQHPTPPARFPFLRIWQDRAGYLWAFSGLSNYKESTQRKGKHAAMQVSARQDVLFSLSFGFIGFRLSCGYALLWICHDFFIPTLSRPIDGLMSLSFWVGFLGSIGSWRIGFWREIYRAGICMRIFSRARLSCWQRTMDFRWYTDDTKTPSLRDTGLIVSRAA